MADLVEPHYPKSGKGRRPYPLETMLRIYFMQQYFALSAPTMEDTCMTSHRCAGGNEFAAAGSDLLVRKGTRVDATIIEAPSSPKNARGTRAPEMHQTKKGHIGHFGMKAHVGVNPPSRRVHTGVSTVAYVNDVTPAHALLPDDEELAFGAAGYSGGAKRKENLHRQVQWHIARPPGQRRAWRKGNMDRMGDS